MQIYVILRVFGLAQGFPFFPLGLTFILFFGRLDRELRIRLPAIVHRSAGCGRLMLCFLIFMDEFSDVLALIGIELPENFFVDIAGGIAIHFEILFGD